MNGLERCQVLVVGTDGIWETQGPGGEMFGKERLQDTIRRVHERPARQIGDVITAALAEFRDEASQHDDITLVVIKKTG